MIEIPIYNTDGKEIDKMQVDPARLGGTVRPHLLKQALVMYHANKRQGTVRTLARGEVAGSTRKMYKQKGTGNARTGGIRNPIKKGGGHAKQKHPKDWRLAMPKKMRGVDSLVEPETVRFFHAEVTGCVEDPEQRNSRSG